MNIIDLGGSWLFRAGDRRRSLTSQEERATSWMDAFVPGTIHTDLMANGVIPDPHEGTNELKTQWVEFQDWSYKRDFHVPPELLDHDTIDLVAEGLDTFSRIRINGKNLGGTSNMFVEHRLSARKYLRAGKNTIEVEFESPTRRAKALEKKYGTLEVALEPHRVYTRKAQYSYGWDWGPKLTTSGIWGGIVLQAFSRARIGSVRVKIASLTARAAVVRVGVEIERMQKKSLTMTATIEGYGFRKTITKRLGGNRTSATFRIPDPNLWWPNGQGEQNLYHVTVSILDDEVELDTASTRLGLRTVKLIQEKDGTGTSFVFEINGRKIFSKGVNWIPADSFLPRVSVDRYRKYLTMARDAHVNMVRVWGGGVYEREVFYNLCDELGLMVWQDFMFACGEYPDNAGFLSGVKDEAEKVVRRLRNHPCIVIWCGNNECEWGYCAPDSSRRPDDMTGSVIFRDILRSVVIRLDGTRPYWRSSPYGKGFPNGESSGNHHQWTVWSAWKDYPEYERSEARFVTEFGFQGPANAETYGTSLTRSAYGVQTPAMEHHNKQVEGTERMFRFLAAHYHVPSDPDEFIYKAQIVQAEALKRAVEHWRRRKYKTAGTLIWQLNDCWPVTSWSLIDSAIRPKAAYFYARRFFAPVLLSFRKTEADRVAVWLTNDTTKAVRGSMKVSLMSYRSGVAWDAFVETAIGPDGSREVFEVPEKEILSVDRSGHYLLARIEWDNDQFAENRFHFVEPKHMQLNDPSIRKNIERKGEGEYRIRMVSKAYAKDVHLNVRPGQIETDDNYFDLDPGVSKHIVVRTNLSEYQLTQQLIVRSHP